MLTGHVSAESQPVSTPIHRRSGAAGTQQLDVAGALWTLVRTDFKARYHGTAMGFVWAMLKPIAMFLVLLSVFTFVFANQPDYTIRLVLGLFLYDYFQESTKAGLVSLHAKGYLIGRSRFPRWLLVLASTANPLIVIATASLAILVYLALIGRSPGLLGVALYLFYLVLFALFVIGFDVTASATMAPPIDRGRENRMVMGCRKLPNSSTSTA